MVVQPVCFLDCVLDREGAAGDGCARDSASRRGRGHGSQTRPRVALDGDASGAPGCRARRRSFFGGLGDGTPHRNWFDESFGSRFGHGRIPSGGGATTARLCRRRHRLLARNHSCAPRWPKDLRRCSRAVAIGASCRSSARRWSHTSRQRHSAAPRFALRAGAHPARRMMTALGIGNRAMFWRIVRRLLGANRGRLFVILLALGAGAAVTAALLNLQVDAKRRITTEFQAFGANVRISPLESEPSSVNGATLDQSIASLVPRESQAGKVAITSFLYVIADASAMNPESQTSQVVVAGIAGDPLITVMPFQEISGAISLGSRLM